MTEIKTKDQILKLLLDGHKLRDKNWFLNHFVYLKNGCFVSQDNNSVPFHVKIDSEWEIYQGPKPKIKRWLWSYSRSVADSSKHYMLSSYFMTEEEALKYIETSIYHSKNNLKKFGEPIDCEE